ncbi:putative C6 transcription factor [Talaromyces proteolyticus]|uniref:C6 transcription factor n=1 Tax=Talaromyces proteolyticus TaxID=1131652 RepID=A0AAD4L591_9EURO|nr:putative C6 transcription factor [Talaromyces proteolyticus]KAH8705316.1 putative C6 transcription factor [Talaromyces proteolyticus]
MASTADTHTIQDDSEQHVYRSNSQDQGADAAAAAAAAAAAQHRRGYQACDPCRKRKVKCDLGSVDNPRPPPCVRCRRESKRCEFSATRRKRKASDADQEAEGPLRRDRRMMIGEVSYSESPSIGSNGNNNESPYVPPATASYESGGGLTKPQWPETSPSVAHRPTPVSQKDQYQPSAPPATSNFRDTTTNIQSGSYSMHSRASTGIESRQHVMNKTAADLLFPTISNSHDALHLLSEAAGRTEDLNRQSLENRTRQSATPYGASISGNQGGFSRNGRHPFPKPEHSTPGDGYGHAHGSDYRKQSISSYEDPGYLDAVKAWSRLRFVRAGWLTVEEAMAYIAYYYKNLAPLSPIVIPDFSPPSTHRTLLTDEPVLAVAMLTTASRHMKPKGDGSHTRGYYIHDRLWAYLRGMIERLFWGQEKFAGNPGMSTPRSLDIGSPQAPPSLRGNLRSLGTVEALLILTDWHPRNLHFPPGDDENTLLDADALLPSQTRGDAESESRGQNGGGLEGRLAFQKWLEPTWRSDRMSWMLLSTAQALAFELGVFDRKVPSPHESIAEQMRKRRVRRLIIVYVTQGSGRLGIPSMLPLDKWSGDIGPLSPQDASDVDISTDRMQDLWVQISRIMSLSNSDLFPSKEQSSELIQTGRYKQQIAEFIPRLQTFKTNLEAASLSTQMRNILSIEYEYTRIYVNCLALQAVVERWTAINNEPSNKSSASGSLRVLMELYRVNEKYIQEVVDASRRILNIVLEGLVPGDHLKHCPVRTFFRILSAMIFILKTFTLGATEDDVRVSLALQDRTIEALRTCVVDDVHLSNTISRLLELLTTNIRTRFLRFAPTDRGIDGDGHERNSQPDSRVSSPKPTRDSSQVRRDAQNQWQQAQNTNQNVGYQVDHGQQPVTSYHDPLANIPAQPINSSNIGVSFMPPPPSVYYNYYDPNDTPPKLDEAASIAQSVHEGGLPDWFALPLDQFFNNSTGGVDQGLGSTGPMLGEFDMLEVLLNEQYDKDGSAGAQGGNNGVGAVDSTPDTNHHSFM